MPVHDWTRVEDGIFHDFHGAWIAELRRVLNSGLLPANYYALGEQVTQGAAPDVLTLQAPREENGVARPRGSVALTEEVPRLELMAQGDLKPPTRRQRSVVIRHVSNHRIVALLEIISPGNKSSRNGIRALLDKVAAALSQGIHLLLLDLHPPGPRDPEGLHALVWKTVTGDEPERPLAKPLTLAAYVAGTPCSALVQSVGVGDTLPEMPLFLERDEYVNVPLEPTYLAAYVGVPRWYKDILES